MNRSTSAGYASLFFDDFKAELLNQIYELNSFNDGALQDGFNPQFLNDGWVSLKGYACGFVMHFDDPIRVDMTVGPDWPSIGYRTTFLARAHSDGFMWVNQDRPKEIYFNAAQLARQGLRRLASKVGDEWIFNAEHTPAYSVEHDAYFGNNLRGS